jgi:hypothetical protein
MAVWCSLFHLLYFFNLDQKNLATLVTRAAKAVDLLECLKNWTK